MNTTLLKLIDEHRRQLNDGSSAGPPPSIKTEEDEEDEEEVFEEEAESGSSSDEEIQETGGSPPKAKSASPPAKAPKRGRVLVGGSKQKRPKITLCSNAEIIDTRPPNFKYDETKKYNLGSGWFLQIGQLTFSNSTMLGLFFIKPSRGTEKPLKFNLPLPTIEPLYAALGKLIGEQNE